MTRTISLIIGIATVALVVAVPTAFGEGRVGSLQVQDDTAYIDANERVLQPQSLTALEARSIGMNKKYGLGDFASQPGAYKDASERTVQPQSLTALEARSIGMNKKYGLGDFAVTEGYVDANERTAPPAQTTPVVTATASGTDIEWPQVGIAFGIGIVLLLGLGLAMRAAHVRPFAH
jgi:hypothetical protein